jgi:hypothetical protein
MSALVGTSLGGSTYSKRGVSVKDLDGLGGIGIKDIPMVHGSLSDEAELLLADPLPEDNIFGHDEGLELLLGIKVEYLQGASLGLEGNNLAGPVHDSRVGLDGLAADMVVVLELNDYDLGLGVLVDLLADAEVRVGFKSLAAMEVSLGLNWNAEETYAAVETYRRGLHWES